MRRLNDTGRAFVGFLIVGIVVIAVAVLIFCGWW